MNKKWFSLTAVALLLSGSLVACSNGETPEPATQDGVNTEAPASTEAPADASTEAPADASTEAPADASTEAPADATTEAPADASTEAPADAATETSEAETTNP